jgi:hypothetical protein
MTTTPADLTRLAFGKLNASLALPGSPAMIVSRMSSESLSYTPNVVESPELDPSGQLRDSIFVGSSSAGNVEFPLVRSDWFHEMLAAVFRSGWGVGTYGDNTVDPAIFVPTPVGANELIPGKLLSMYAVQKKFDTPTAPSYHLFDRVGVGSLSLKVQPNEVLSGTIALMGGVMTPGTTDIAGATYADPGVYKPFTSPNVTEIGLSGLTTQQCFNQLTLAFNSNLRGIPCIGSESDREKALGRFVPTIEGTTYFVSNEHVQALKNQTFIEVFVTLTDGSGNEYHFYYPKCKFVTAPVVTPGSNQEVMQPVSLRAHFSPNHGYSCKVKRVLAA